MNYQLLWNEISQPAYAGMSDAEIAAVLNAASVTRQRVPYQTLAQKARELMVTYSLRVAAESPDTPVELKALAAEVLSLMGGDTEEINLDHPTSQQMLGMLLQAGVITPQQAAGIDALANVVTPSRAESLELGVVTEADIEAARDWKIAELMTQAQAIQQRLDQLHMPTSDELLAWAEQSYPFAALVQEREGLEHRLAEINALLERLNG